MENYLENNICDFEILFNYNNKNKNILSTSFFKMKKHYKNFNIYKEGLKKLIKLIDNQNNYILRIFIDSHIKEDSDIMKILNSSNKVEIIVFKCLKYIKDDYHIDLFATLIRLFPIFNFKNNDSNNVIIIDVDLKKNDIKTLEKILKIKENKKKIIGNGTAEDLLINKIKPYYYCNLVCFFNIKFEKKILEDFINNIENIKDCGKYNKRTTPFGFGVDEIFLNKFLLTDKNINKIDIGVLFLYDINWFFYYYKDELLKENYNLTYKNLRIILGKYYKKNNVYELFKLIDKYIYNISNNNKIKNYLSARFYYLIKNLINNKIEWFHIDNLKLINKYFNNIVESESIIFYNNKTLEIKDIEHLSIKLIK
jgi:hypothetical protein